MAAVDTQNNPNDPNNPNNPQLPGNQPAGQVNQPATTGGAGAVTSTGAGNVTGQVTGTANPSQPFQNIASYLAANAPGGQQLANQVAGNVSQPITQAQNDVTNAANTFTQSVNAGYTPENTDLINAVASNPAAVVAENPQNVTNFQANLKDTYTGPTDFTTQPGFANLESEIANAQGAAANTQTPAGVESLLGAVEGPTTAGINKFDSILLNQNPANIAAIQAAGAPAANLTPGLNTLSTDENALAAQSGTAASTAASDAAAALQKALSGETGNLTNEQNIIQGIVDEYNKSVGVINPVTQTIAQDIQNFLAANPQLSLSDATNALAPLENLTPITMPTEATYASPGDYQTLAALASLGIDPSALAGLPITSATANEAQTFQVPTALQNAVGQAPGVEQALTGELGTIGNEINTAIAPFESAQSQSDTGRQTFNSIVGNANIYAPVTPTSYPTLTDPTTGQKVPATIPQTNRGPSGRGTPVTVQVPNPAWQALQKQAQQAAGLADQGDASKPGLAPGLQWVNQAAPAYNDLIQAINDQLGKLGSVGVPTLTYSPTTLTDPVTGVPIGEKIASKVPGLTTAAALGGSGAAGVGAGLAQSAGAAEAASTVGAETADTVGAEAGNLGEGLATSGAPAAEASTSAVPLSTGLTTFGQTVGPAALAAYGASNIAQNAAKNPVTSGLEILGNMGLSLATLSLPPKIFESIGKDITNVLNDIGNFFSGLF